MTDQKSYAAETKGDLRITYADGRVEVIPQRVADLHASEVVTRPRNNDDTEFGDVWEDGWGPISSGLMLTDPEDEPE